MKLATTTCDFAKYTDNQEMAMEYIKQAGFCYVDYSFDMDADYKNGIYSSDFDGYIDKIKRKADLLGLTFVQAHSPLGKPIAEGNSAFVEDTIKCVRACSKLGIKNLVVHSGYDFNISKEETFEKNKAFYNKILCEAEKYEINILTENFNKMCIENLYWIDNASDLLKLIEYVDHPLFHAVWDTGHANMQKTPQDECLRLLGNHVYALHVHDNFGDEDSHMAPFFGTMNMASLMKGLRDINYNGYFTFEACNVFAPERLRTTFSDDTRFMQAPLELKLKAEKLIYETGKLVLGEYGIFEE